LKRLTKKQSKFFADLIDEMTLAHESAIEAADDFNEVIRGELAERAEALGEALGVLNAKIEAYNEGVEEIRDLAEQYYDERSERWQESEAGESYQEWIDAMEEIEELDTDTPETEEVEEPDMDILPYLPRSPEEL
jgi:hypothetical protein